MSGDRYPKTDVLLERDFCPNAKYVDELVALLEEALWWFKPGVAFGDPEAFRRRARNAIERAKAGLGE